MSIELHEAPVQSTGSLVTGILGDLQRLVEQQFELTRREIEEEVRQRVAAATMFAAGLGSVFIGAVGLCLAVAHLLHWAASPPGADPAAIPLWACHALVAVVVAIVGAILMQTGRKWFTSIESFHNPITEILQEPTR